MGEKMDALTENLEQLVKDKGLSPAKAVLEAGLGINPDNAAKVLELANEVGISQSGSDSTSLMHMAQQLVAALDPNTKQSLASFLSEVIEESNVGSPPPDVQQFIANLSPKPKPDN